MTAAAATAAVCLASAAWAQERQLAIPAGELKAALSSFSVQTGRGVVYRADDLDNVRSRGFQGSATPEVALRALLADTGFSAHFDPSGSAAISRDRRGSLGRPARVAPAGATSPVAATETGAEGDGEILVTARRRTESVQDVPVAISVLGGAELSAKNALHVQQFYQEVPSLTVYTYNSRSVTVNIRGLGSSTAVANIGLEGGVGLYIDDVYYARVNPAVFNLVDLDRIEVLRGPQGTLFGRNTTAGALSISTRAPSFKTEGSLEASIGNYGYYSTRGSIGGAIVEDKLAGRLTVEATQRGGFLKNVNQANRIHDFNNYTVRGQLLFQPSDDVKVRLIGDLARNSQVCCAALTLGYVTQYDDGTPVPNAFLTRVAQFGYKPVDGDPKDRIIDVDRQRAFRSTQGGLSAQVDWDFGANTLTSISAYRFWNSKPRNDGDFTGLQISLEAGQDDRQRQFSQEIRIASNGERTIDYVAGLYYFYQSYGGVLRVEYGRDAGVFHLAPGTQGLTTAERAATLDGAHLQADSVARTNSYAAFGQATWHITDGLSFTGGLRYTRERKSGNFVQQRLSRVDTSGLSATQLALRNGYLPVVPYYELAKSWNSLGALATISQKLSRDALIYATYSRGEKSGGLNFANLPRDGAGNLLTDLAVVAPEKVDSYEIGLKSEFLDRRLTINVAAFLTNVSNLQSTILDATTTPTRTYIGNVGKVRSKGIEAEIRARPFEGLNLYASGTYNPTKYIDYTNAACPFELLPPGVVRTCDLSGRQLPAAPRYAASAGGDLTLPLSDRVDGFIGADYSYRSGYYTTYNLSRYSLLDSATLVNMRVGVRSSDGGWQATLWGRNIFNKLIFNQAFVDVNPGGRLIGWPADPRTWGATIQRKF